MSEKIYYPYCRECNSLLSFEIEPLNFSIKYICENNESHNKRDIYFKTFERFYLKERGIIKCVKCNINLESSEYYNCEECKSIYCNKCYLEDIQKNGHYNSFKAAINNNRCLTHKNDFTKYCLTCHENICFFCIKNEDFHEGHIIKSYYELIPSLDKIKSIRKKFLEKSQFTNNLIE